MRNFFLLCVLLYCTNKELYANKFYRQYKFSIKTANNQREKVYSTFRLQRTGIRIDFCEDELVKNLQAEIVSINTECCKVLRLISCKKTTGYMKERYKAVLNHYNQDIENLSKQIEKVKKTRHEKQKQGLKY